MRESPSFQMKFEKKNKMNAFLQAHMFDVIYVIAIT